MLARLAAGGGIAHLLRNRKLAGLSMATALLWNLRCAYRRQPQIDVVHANWLQTALPLWRTKTPVVVSVLGSDFGLLRLPGMTSMLRAVLRERRAILAPNAEWMVPKLIKAFGDIAEVRPIPFGVDKSWFNVERHQAPDGLHHWLVVSRVTRGKIGRLFEWGRGVFDDGHRLHLLGPMQEPITLPNWVKYHGPTNPQALREEWFPAAAGLITLSTHDEGRPQVMLEAMAAGLPVIALDIDAHRDLVRHHDNGYLVGSKDEFLEAIQVLSNRDTNVTLGHSARAWVVRTIGTWDDCALKYIEAYRAVLET